jgi:hypothetical protein
MSKGVNTVYHDFLQRDYSYEKLTMDYWYHFIINMKR